MPDTHSNLFDFESTLARVRHWLPAQGPIKDFVHHNTLHAFEHLEFHSALRAAARLYGARSYMPGEFYLAAYGSGEITRKGIDRALNATFSDEHSRASARARMLSGPVQAPRYVGASRSGLRAYWDTRLDGVSLARLAHPPLFRLIGGYLDQGLSIWRMPGADQQGFLKAVGALVEASWLPLYPYSAPRARQLFKLPAPEAATIALQYLVQSEELYEAYLLESLLAQPGWAGLVGQCEVNPSSLLSPRRITLADYVAVTLITEVGCLEKTLGNSFQPLTSSAVMSTARARETTASAPDAVPPQTEEEKLLSVWQDAFEWSYYDSLLGGIVAVAESKLGASSSNPSARPSPTKKIASSWAFFCIDDRECSLRRHIEEVDPRIGTFATAGFFGLDFMYRGAGDSVAAKHCPGPVTPKHMIIEELDEPRVQREASLWHRMTSDVQHFKPGANTFFRGWVLSYALGIGAMLRLAASVFRPSMASVFVPPLSTVSENGRLRLIRDDEAAAQNGLHFGYTINELAERVQGVLQSVGAGEDWPRLIVFFGHGSSSVNNPYFSAYNCGACSGSPGAPNARAFAHAANLPAVREALSLRGIHIPDGTWFIGALHNTSLDQVTYFDLEKVPADARDHLSQFQASIGLALGVNAQERCRRFETLPEGLNPEAALAAVKNRAVSLFEPRPEYNHATNASCIVGRRAMTERLFLDRRAFLSSYDPTQDSDGEILTGILGAVIPVCGGINLEYYFSRIDPEIYGAGSKLPQNVTGLIGVLNGIEGDLLTGLPTQMTEIHDPVRLLVVVEQTPQIALEAARKDPKIFEWITNGWVHYSSVDPKTAEAYLYREGQMQKLARLEAPQKSRNGSLAAWRSGRRNLPVTLREEEL